MSELDAFYKANQNADYAYEDAPAPDEGQSQWIDGEASPVAKKPSRRRWYIIAVGVLCVAGVLFTVASLTSPPKLQGQPTVQALPAAPVQPTVTSTVNATNLLLQTADNTPTASAADAANALNNSKATQTTAVQVPDIQPIHNTQTPAQATLQAPTQAATQAPTQSSLTDAEKSATNRTNKPSESVDTIGAKATTIHTDHKATQPSTQIKKPIKPKSNRGTQPANRAQTATTEKPTAQLVIPPQSTPPTKQSLHLYGVTIVGSQAKALVKQGELSKTVTVGDALEGIGQVERIGVRQGTPYMVVAGNEY